jgi:hypothetical protein
MTLGAKIAAFIALVQTAIDIMLTFQTELATFQTALDDALAP